MTEQILVRCLVDYICHRIYGDSNMAGKCFGQIVFDDIEMLRKFLDHTVFDDIEHYKSWLEFWPEEVL